MMAGVTEIMEITARVEIQEEMLKFPGWAQQQEMASQIGRE